MKQSSEEIQVLRKEWELVKRQNKLNACMVLGAIIVCGIIFTAIVNMFAL